MPWSLIQLVLNFAMKLLPFLSKKKEEQERAAKAIKEATDTYQRGSKDSAVLRDTHKELDDELEAKWEEKWGTPPPPKPAEPIPTPPASDVKIIAPAIVNKGTKFVVKFVKVPVGAQVFVDEQHFVYTVGTATETELVLNTAGENRTLDVRFENKWIASTTITVK